MPEPTLYETLLGPSWNAVPDVLRSVHGPGMARGAFDVERGPGLLTAFLAALFGLPTPGRGVPVHLRVTAGETGQEWARTFGSRRMASIQRPDAAGVLLERYGVVECRLAVSVAGDALTMRSTGAALRLGPVRIPLPPLLAPLIEGRATADGDAARVEVAIRSGWGALLLRYHGAVRPDGAA